MRLNEKLVQSVKDNIYQVLWNSLADGTDGEQKFTKNIADINVGDDTIDIAFDFRDPTGTEVEVTQKHIDKFMVNRLPALYSKVMGAEDFFRVQPVKHEWNEQEEILYCLYDIVQMPRYKSENIPKGKHMAAGSLADKEGNGIRG